MVSCNLKDTSLISAKVSVSPSTFTCPVKVSLLRLPNQNQTTNCSSGWELSIKCLNVNEDIREKHAYCPVIAIWPAVWHMYCILTTSVKTRMFSVTRPWVWPGLGESGITTQKERKWKKETKGLSSNSVLWYCAELVWQNLFGTYAHPNHTYTVYIGAHWALRMHVTLFYHTTVMDTAKGHYIIYINIIFYLP